MLSMLFPILCEAPSEKADDDEDFDEAHTAPAFVASVSCTLHPGHGVVVGSSHGGDISGVAAA